MEQLKCLAWVGSSKNDLKKFPEAVQREVGYALHIVQTGGKPDDAKPLTGVASGVFEVVTNYDSDTYRTVYAVKIKNIVYVLHCFQKKSKRGIQTPKQEVDLIKQRLRDAKEHSRAVKLS